MGPDLDCYQTTVQVGEIKKILGHDPRSKQWSQLAKYDPEAAELYAYIQRKSPAERLDELREYMRSRLCSERPRVLGALPAISIAFQYPVASFESEDKAGEKGDLFLPPRGRVILLDGLQRATAAMDFLNSQTKLFPNFDINKNFVFAATFYFPTAAKGELKVRELGQLFFDMNYKAKAMSAVHAMKLDQADPYLLMTTQWGEDGIIAELGGVEDGGSLGNKSKAFVVRTHLFKFIRGAIEGREVQEHDKSQPDSPRLNDENYSAWSLQLQGFLRQLNDHMGVERFTSRESIHLSSGGWQILGLIHNDLYVTLADAITEEERRIAVQRLAGLDWSRYNPKWIELYGEAKVDSHGRQMLGKTNRWGRSTKTAMLQYVREQVGIVEHFTSEAVVASTETAEQVQELLLPAAV